MQPAHRSANLGKQRGEEVRTAVLARPRTFTEHAEELGVCELVVTQEIDAALIASELEHIGCAELARRCEHIVAMLDEGRLFRIHYSVEFPQRLLAGPAGHTIVTQIAHECCTMNLLQRKSSQRQELAFAPPRDGDGAHADFMLRMPLLVPRRLREQ